MAIHTSQLRTGLDLLVPEGSVAQAVDLSLFGSDDVEQMLGTEVWTINPRGNQVLLRFVKNASGSAITGGKLGVRYSTTTGRWGKDIAGLAADAGYGRPVYEAHGSIADGYGFWIVVGGDALVTTPSTGTHAIAAGDVCCWAGSGRAREINAAAEVSGSFAQDIFAELTNAFGRAITSASAVDTDFRVDVGGI